MTPITPERVKELKRFLCDRKNEFVSELKRFEYLGNVEFKEAMSRRIAFYSDLLAVIDSYSKAKGDMAKELRELVRTGRLLVTGDPADVSALINSLDEHSALKAEVSDQKKALDLCGYIIEPIRNERDALKAENERLRAEAPIANVQLSGDGEYWKARAEKAEAELAQVNAALDLTLRQVANLDRQIDSLEAELAKQAPLIEAAEELSYVAGLRGDDELPHPSNDSKMWTARMQTAWDNLRDALALRDEKGK
jgi:chromosome segregation ATPase